MVGGKLPISVEERRAHLRQHVYWLPTITMSFCGTRRRVGVPGLLCSVRPKPVNRCGIQNEGYLMDSLIQSSEVNLHRPLQCMRDHSGRRALVVEPDFELDGRCTGVHG